MITRPPADGEIHGVALGRDVVPLDVDGELHAHALGAASKIPGGYERLEPLRLRGGQLHRNATPMPSESRRITCAATSISPAPRGKVTWTVTSPPTTTWAPTRSFMPERLTSMTSPVTTAPSVSCTTAGHGTCARGSRRRSVAGKTASARLGLRFVLGRRTHDE